MAALAWHWNLESTVMRRWNGWGDDSNSYAVKPNARQFIVDKLGHSQCLPEASFADVVASVPASKLAEHRLLNLDPEQRVRHARGQSLPDWLAMRSGQYGNFPDAVAFPISAAEVRELLDHARDVDALVIPYGGGTSVVGHITTPQSERPVITINMGRMSGLLNLDEDSRLATFGAGVAGPDLEAQLRARGYMLGHFPQSFELSTLGGWIASRSSGQQSLHYGRIEQLFAGGTMETPNGSLQIPSFPASSAGLDLRELALGSEGRMGIITEATVRVKPLPEHESFRVAFIPDWERAQTLVREIIQRGIGLSMLRLSGAVETETQLVLAGHPRMVAALQRYLSLRGVGEGKCMLTFGVTGNRSQCKLALKAVKSMIRAAGGVNGGTGLGEKWRQSRFRTPYLRESLWQMGYLVDTLETATDWPYVNTMVDAIETALKQSMAPEPIHVFTHLSHIYAQGSSVYTTYLFKMADSYEETLSRWCRVKAAASNAVVAHRGTISHQHGVGSDHAPWLAVEKGEMGIGAIDAVCRYFDPQQRMNIGKLLPPLETGE
jgi:alkyldihydroxyacetonephosphate synthase